MMKKKTMLIIGAVAIVGIGALAIPFMIPAGEVYNEVTSTTQTIERYYTFTGSVAAKNQEAIVAPIQMQVDEVRVELGQQVAVGDVLVVSAQGLELTANVAGEVTSVSAEVDGLYPQGAPLVSVTDLATLEIDILADEYEVSQLAVGQSVDIYLNALETTVSGSVSRVDRVGQVVNGVAYFPTVVTFNAPSDVRVGYTSEIKLLQARAENVLSIPLASVQFSTENEPFIYCQPEATVVECPLGLGLSDGMNVEVISGIDAETLIYTPVKTASSGFSMIPPIPGR